MAKRFLISIFAGLAAIGSVAAQTLPVVPPVADAARYQAYNLSTPTTTILLNFPIYGDCSDLEMVYNGAIQPAAGPSSTWNCSSVSGGANLSALPLPITDGQVTLTPSLSSGFLQIIGDIHPRRLSQPTQPGIARRDYNVDISQLTVEVRELWDALARFIATPGIGTGNLVSTNNLSDVANTASSLANLGGAPLASPALTGSPTAPTQTGGDSSTKIATDAFVANAVGHSGAFSNLASASTTDLGTITTQNATITGSVTITSFGSSAATSSPIYNFVIGSGAAPLLTQNATSLILPGGKSIQTAAGDYGQALYLGSGNWRIIDYTPAAGPSVFAVTTRCGATGLKIVNDTTAPLTQVDVTAGIATLTDSAGRSINATSLSTTISALDTGSLASNSWYYIWLYGNAAGTVAGELSLSSTAPILPGSNTYSCRIGAIRTNGSTQFPHILQLGNYEQQVVTLSGPLASLGSITGGTLYTSGTYTNVPLTGGSGSGAQATVVVSGGAVTTVTRTANGSGYQSSDTLSAAAANIGGTGSGFSVPVNSVTTPTAALPIMRSANEGSTTSPTYVSFSIASFVPPTATRITGFLYGCCANTSNAILAPNANYGSYNSTTNPPPVQFNGTGTGGGATAGGSTPFDFIIENQASPTLDWASNSSSNATIFLGFVDSVNAS